MNIRTLTTVAASLMLISGMITTNLWRELRAEREATAVLRDKLAESEGRIQVAEAAARADAEAAARLQARAPAPVAAKQPEVAAVRSSVVTVVSGAAGNISISEQELLQDPDYRRARLMILRSSIHQTYPGIADELGLTPQEADQLFDLLAGNQMDQAAQLLALSGDQQPNQAVLSNRNQARQAMQRELNDSLRAMLGDNRYRQWQDYQQTRSQRMQVNGYATTLAQAGVPMDTSQNKALVAAVIAEERQLQVDTVALGRMVDPSNPESRVLAQEALRNRQSETNRRILDSASATLSPQQLDVLRAQIEQQEVIERAQVQVRQRTESMRLQQ